MAGMDDADVLTQDVFVRAWQKLGGFRGESRFATWLHRVAVNVIIEHRRCSARRSWLEADDEDAVAGASVREANSGLSMDLQAAVDRLPEGARRVFVLHDVEGYKHREIGELMGISTGTSKGQLHRARMALRKHLNATRAVLSDNEAPI
jgi:RNA polymerase sigma-70 factor (ECF subfamily)